LDHDSPVQVLPSGHDTHSLELEPYKLVVVVAAAAAAVADPLRQISGIRIQELLFHSFWGQDNLQCSQKLRDYHR
ncbi:hypothetical protein Tco_0618998, partial [Tanacetum coccineum]